MRLKPSLESKFVALASVFILIGSVLMNSWVANLYRNQILLEAEKKALLLVKSAAISFSNTLLYQELNLVEEGGLLENYIQDLLSDSLTAVTTVIVYDAEGRVLATNDYDNYFLVTDSEQVARWSHLDSFQLTRNSNSLTILYPLRISTKRFGTLNMNFTLTTEQKEFAEFKRLLFMVTFALTITAIGIAYLVARTLARPIKRLAAEMLKVTDPTFVATVETKRRDEIGDLERGFVDMLSRLKKAAEQKEGQQRALIQAEKLASIGTLVSGLAHEINNPLAGLRNCLRRIMSRPADTSQTKKYAELMDEALLRIENLVRNLLDYSRKRELLKQRADLNRLISSACNLIDYQIESKKLKLRKNLAQPPLKIEADSQQMEQVFVNLLLNAVDASHEGGSIVITTLRRNDEIIAEVVDTGDGISAEIKDSVFDPFFTTKPVGKGTGLGLSITKTIVEEHQGRIDILNGKNGTTVRLSFPEDPDRPEPPRNIKDNST